MYDMPLAHRTVLGPPACREQLLLLSPRQRAWLVHIHGLALLLFIRCRCYSCTTTTATAMTTGTNTAGSGRQQGQALHHRRASSSMAETTPAAQQPAHAGSTIGRPGGQLPSAHLGLLLVVSWRQRALGHQPGAPGGEPVLAGLPPHLAASTLGRMDGLARLLQLGSAGRLPPGRRPGQVEVGEGLEQVQVPPGSRPFPLP